MFGKHNSLSPLESRKQLLLAESEINRVQLLREWETMTDGVHAVAGQVKAIGSLISAAASLVSILLSFRRARSASTKTKPSWLRKILKGAQLAGSIWLALRARPKS